MLDEKTSHEYQRVGLSMISAAYYKGGTKMTVEELKLLAPSGDLKDIEWGALVGILVGLGEFFLHETEDPEEVLGRVGLALAQQEAALHVEEVEEADE